MYWNECLEQAAEMGRTTVRRSRRLGDGVYPFRVTHGNNESRVLDAEGDLMAICHADDYVPKRLPHHIR